MTTGRPTEYNTEILTKTKEYISNCVDEIDEFHRTRGTKSDSYDRLIQVKLPTIAGLSIYLKVNRDTIYDWESKYPEFSDILSELRSVQEDRLINSGLNGDYNPIIAKLLLMKHGYKDKTDVTTNDKELPTPILDINAIRSNNSNKEDSQPH